ncbi:hypothetical protein SRHO_G00100810 [Serrasalmus rhombeus]
MLFFHSTETSASCILRDLWVVRVTAGIRAKILTSATMLNEKNADSSGYDVALRGQGDQVVDLLSTEERRAIKQDSEESSVWG